MAAADRAKLSPALCKEKLDSFSMATRESELAETVLRNAQEILPRYLDNLDFHTLRELAGLFGIRADDSDVQTLVDALVVPFARAHAPQLLRPHDNLVPSPDIARVVRGERDATNLRCMEELYWRCAPHMHSMPVGTLRSMTRRLSGLSQEAIQAIEDGVAAEWGLGHVVACQEVLPAELNEQ